MARFSSATDIINQVLVEVGLDPVEDPYSSSDKNAVKMTFLLNTAGNELVMLYPWAILRAEATITTSSTENPDGGYDLPSDFAYKTDQTGWNRTQRLPLAGPFSAQDWSYVIGRALVTSTIYLSFRIMENKFFIFPADASDNDDIRYEYTTRNWAAVNAAPTTPAKDAVTTGTDIPLFEALIIQRYLKLKYRDSTGQDTRSAQADFDQVFAFWTSKDKSGEVLSASRNSRSFPYLDSYRNTPDTNFGL